MPPHLKFDVFLSHDWGSRDEGYPNLQRARVFYRVLVDAGYRVFLDDQSLFPDGDLDGKLLINMYRSRCIVLLGTHGYFAKVNSGKMRDMCRAEYRYSIFLHDNCAAARILVCMDTPAALRAPDTLTCFHDHTTQFVGVADLGGDEPAARRVVETLLAQGLAPAAQALAPAAPAPVPIPAVQAPGGLGPAASPPRDAGTPPGSPAGTPPRVGTPPRRAARGLSFSQDVTDVDRACNLVAHALETIVWELQHHACRLGAARTVHAPLAIDRGPASPHARAVLAAIAHVHDVHDAITFLITGRAPGRGADAAVAVPPAAHAVAVCCDELLTQSLRAAGPDIMQVCLGIAADRVGPLAHYTRAVRAGDVAARRAALAAALEACGVVALEPGVVDADRDLRVVCARAALWREIALLDGPGDARTARDVCAAEAARRPDPRRGAPGPECAGYRDALHAAVHALNAGCTCETVLRRAAACMAADGVATVRARIGPDSDRHVSGADLLRRCHVDR